MKDTISKPVRRVRSIAVTFVLAGMKYSSPVFNPSLSFNLITAWPGSALPINTSFSVAWTSAGSMLKMTCSPGPSRSMSITPTRHPLMARETATFEVIVLLPVPPLNECTAMLTPILFLPRYFSFLREDAVVNWSLMDRKKSEDWTLLTVCMTFSVSSATERCLRLGTSFHTTKAINAPTGASIAMTSDISIYQYDAAPSTSTLWTTLSMLLLTGPAKSRADITTSHSPSGSLLLIW